MLPKKAARRWYLAGVILSVIALAFAVVSQMNPRLGYPLAFMFTMCGVLAITRPSWELPEKRRYLAVSNGLIFMIQLTILTLGMATAL